MDLSMGEMGESLRFYRAGVEWVHSFQEVSYTRLKSQLICGIMPARADFKKPYRIDPSCAVRMQCAGTS